MSIVRGDARRLPFADGAFQTCVTSPPYWGLRDYGVSGQIGLESSPEEYVVSLVSVFREVRRVLRDDGTLWLNLGDSYAGSGKGAWDNKEGGQKEVYIPDSDSPQASIPKVPSGLKPKDLVGIPWRVAFALQADGWWLRSDIIWAKPNPMPESVTDRPTKAHEYLFLLAKSEIYYYDAEVVKEQAVNDRTDNIEFGPRPDKGYPGHMNDRRRASSKRLAEGHIRRGGGALTGGTENSSLGVSAAGVRNRRSVWTVPTQPYSGAHFATFPEKLIEPCILAGAPVGGRVLDPFGGSGTTVRVARRFQRKGYAVELSAAYIALAQERVNGAQVEMFPW